MNLAAARAPRQRVDGVLLIDKPTGISSNAALQHARRLLNAEKAGHTGTLDPLASGLLPLCFGEATKFARFLLESDKRYVAVVRFGVATTTQDAEGEVVETRPVAIARADVEAALPAFVGRISQVPPAYSALKFEGRNYYEYARAGVEIPRAPRDVEIRSLTLTDWSAPDATLDVYCSKGTYVRTLAADLGAVLGCGAHLAGLRRVASGGFDLADAITLDAFAECELPARRGHLLPVDCLLASLPRIDVAEDIAADLREGRAIETVPGEGERFRVYARGSLLGVVVRRDGMLAPDRMARTDAIERRQETAQSGRSV